MEDAPKTFEEFWPYYVQQHADPMCRAWHFAGTSLAFVCLAASLLYPLALLAAPVVGYGFAWIGHFVHEHNRPASWHSPRHFVWSFLGDMRMWRMTLLGQMAAEVAETQPDDASRA